MSFGNLVKQLRVSAVRTARFELNTIESGGMVPALILRYAGEGNAAYVSAVLKVVNSDRSGKAGVVLSEAQLHELRERQIPIFARYVVTGWENFYEDDGSPAPCTPDRVEELFRALIEKQPDGSSASDVFDKLCAFAKDADNFRGAQDTPALGKG